MISSSSYRYVLSKPSKINAQDDEKWQINAHFMTNIAIISAKQSKTITSYIILPFMNCSCALSSARSRDIHLQTMSKTKIEKMEKSGYQGITSSHIQVQTTLYIVHHSMRVLL